MPPNSNVSSFNAGRASRGLAKDNDTDQSEGADGFSDNEGSEEEDEESGSIDSDEDEGANRRSRRGKRHLKKSRARSPKAPAEPSRRSSRQTRHQAAFVDEVFFNVGNLRVCLKAHKGRGFGVKRSSYGLGQSRV